MQHRLLLLSQMPKLEVLQKYSYIQNTHDDISDADKEDFEPHKNAVPEP